MYNIILFDPDGTITNPKEGITKSVQYALTKLGIIENDLDSLVKFIGPPIQESFQMFYGFDEAKTKLSVKYFRERYEKVGMYELTVFPGTEEVLKKLKLKNKKLYIATSKPIYFAEKIINKLGFSSYFTGVIGANMDFTESKKLDVISKIVDQYPNEPKHSFVMVGDRKYDILAAHEHGIDSIAVTYGYGNKKEIEKAKPTYIANSPQELLSILLVDNNQTSLL